MGSKWLLGVALIGSSPITLGGYYAPILVDDITIFVPIFPTIIDGTTGKGVNGAVVTVRPCDTCASTTVTTPTHPGIPGSYSFGSGGLVIPPPVTFTDVEAVEIEVTRNGYRSRTAFMRPKSGVYSGESIDIFPTTSVDSDNDGLPDIQESIIGTSIVNADSDDDAIPDEWEVYGHEYVDYVSLGANPRRKTIFVECDFMTGQRPLDGAVTDVIAAFARAPLVNIDGSNGIDLRLEIGNQVVRDLNLNPVWTEFDAIKNANFNNSRSDAFHYCLFGVNYSNTTSSGIARGIPSADFLVTLGSFTNGTGTRQQQAGTLMHELGHTIGLRHGGDDNVHYKPNYLSIMNYSFQLVGLRFNNVSSLLDYSRFTLAALNENGLNEGDGLNVVGGVDAAIAGYGTNVGGVRLINNAAANVDWNNDGAVGPENVSVDINRDSEMGNLNASVNDWENIIFDGGGVIGAGVSRSSPHFSKRAAQSFWRKGDDEKCPGPNNSKSVR